jgi:hypothetical protein
MVTLVNRAKVATTSTGTGTITLGAAESGYQSFADAGVVNSDVVRYTIEDGDAWEIGTGGINAAVTTMSRTLIESSTGSKLNLSGEAVVYVTATGEDIQQPPSEGAFVDGDKTKLDGIEAGATADQTAAEIKTAYESNADTNEFSDAEQSKLAGIEAGADVTDTANVTAAGALMDSEVTNLAQVKAFDSSDYATAAQGTKADTAYGWGDHAAAGYTTSTYNQGGTGAQDRTVKDKLQETVSVKDFGAVGDGVTDDTASIKNWLESGSNLLYAPAGTYLVAAAGADAGGVNATISDSITVLCAEGAVFKADTNLDNDIIRINADASGYTATRNLSVNWSGGKFDQRLQRNSTVVPYSGDFPPANPGSSATADGFSIRGEVDVSGTPTAGFYRITIKDVETLASDQKHWENAGGDSGMFVSGAVHIHVSNGIFIGNRDLGIYASGLSSGAITGGSCYIGQNKFYGCMFGASTKRLMSNVQIVNNIGYNTSVIATSSHVTTTGDNVMLSSNIGYGAWRVVRVAGGSGVTAFGNQSFEHGHLLQDGSVPTAVFSANNACVSFEGVTNSQAYGNRVFGLNTGFTREVSTVVLQDGSGTDCSENMICQNTADGVHAVVNEKSGESDKAFCWGNNGRNLTGQPVVLTGASSIDRDGPLYATMATVTHTGTKSSTIVATATIKEDTIVNRDRLRIHAAGSISGTAGTKRFSLKLGGAVQRNSPDFSATVEGDWCIDAYIDISTLTVQRMSAQIIAGTEVGAIFNRESQDFGSGDIDIKLIFKLGNTADTMELNAFSVRFD